MKEIITLIIYNTFGHGAEADLLFFIVEGDKSHLDGTYINQVESSESLQDELDGITNIYNELTDDREWIGYSPHTVKFPMELFKETEKREIHVITCGFLP
jgi:hypothetical protein